MNTLLALVYEGCKIAHYQEVSPKVNTMGGGGDRVLVSSKANMWGQKVMCNPALLSLFYCKSKSGESFGNRKQLPATTNIACYVHVLLYSTCTYYRFRHTYSRPSIIRTQIGHAKIYLSTLGGVQESRSVLGCSLEIAQTLPISRR